MEQNPHNILLTNLWLEHIYLSKLTLKLYRTWVLTIKSDDKTVNLTVVFIV